MFHASKNEHFHLKICSRHRYRLRYKVKKKEGNFIACKTFHNEVEKKSLMTTFRQQPWKKRNFSLSFNHCLFYRSIQWRIIHVRVWSGLKSVKIFFLFSLPCACQRIFQRKCWKVIFLLNLLELTHSLTLPLNSNTNHSEK